MFEYYLWIGAWHSDQNVSRHKWRFIKHPGWSTCCQRERNKTQQDINCNKFHVSNLPTWRSICCFETIQWDQFRVPNCSCWRKRTRATKTLSPGYFKSRFERLLLWSWFQSKSRTWKYCSRDLWTTKNLYPYLLQRNSLPQS